MSNKSKFIEFIEPDQIFMLKEFIENADFRNSIEKSMGIPSLKFNDHYLWSDGILGLYQNFVRERVFGNKTRICETLSEEYKTRYVRNSNRMKSFAVPIPFSYISYSHGSIQIRDVLHKDFLRELEALIILNE